MHRGRGLAIGADERMAMGADFAGGSADDTRIFANKNRPHGEIEWLEDVAALKLPIGEKSGLALLPIQIEKVTQRRVHCGAQVESQDGSANVINDDADGGPGLTPPIGASL